MAPAWSILWAKSPASGSEAWHPLAYHLLDVGNTARELLRSPRGALWLGPLACATGWPPEDLPEVVGYLCSLHDLGKANPHFQQMWCDGWQRAKQAGFECHSTITSRHHQETLPAITPWLQRRLCRPDANAVAQAIACHHGDWFGQQTHPVVVPKRDPNEPWRDAWHDARDGLHEWINLQLLPRGWPSGCDRLKRRWPAAVLLNGLLILADWLGSDPSAFPASDQVGPDDYPLLSQQRAEAAVAARRFSDFAPPEPAAEFAQYFSAWPARPLQSALGAAELSAAPAAPFLAIVEAPTGEGKTEAALLLASRTVGPFYFALPTMATSNQMHDRLLEWLGDAAQINLVHGLAALRETHEPAAPAPEEDATGAEQRDLDAWFNSRKRALLSPYGVGTIDQALFAALLVRHVSLRLLGLAGRILIIDEVHAYDTYMSDLLKRLLTWLRELGTSVIMLSATLPSAQRQRLLAAYGAPPPSVAPPDKYPLVTLVEAGQPSRYLTPPADPARARTVTLRQRPRAESELVANELLTSLAQDQGTAAWICNTVGSAQDTYRRLQPQARELGVQLDLFHAQYPVGQREEKASEYQGVYGKGHTGAVRPPRLLVATQVIEQSLDLDFDYLVSELPPIDLLLQRLGRLWRHERARPASRHAPAATILLPDRDEDSKPVWGNDVRIYGEWLLLRTLLELHGRGSVAIPEEVRALVEAVYDDRPVDGAACVQAGLKMAWFDGARSRRDEELDGMRLAARQHLLGEPGGGIAPWSAAVSGVSDDEAAERSGGLGLATRLAPPSIRCIPLAAEDPLLAQLPPNGKPSLDLQRELLRRSLTISRPAAVHPLLKLNLRPCPGWSESGTLAAYVWLPLINDRFDLGQGRALWLSEELGLVVESIDQ